MVHNPSTEYCKSEVFLLAGSPAHVADTLDALRKSTVLFCTRCRGVARAYQEFPVTAALVWSDLLVKGRWVHSAPCLKFGVKGERERESKRESERKRSIIMVFVMDFSRTCCNPSSENTF